MSHYFSGIGTRIADFGTWAHQSLKELPVAGDLYGRASVIASDVKDFVTPYFRDLRNVVEPQIRKHPTALKVGGGILAFVFIRAVYKYNYPDKTK